MSENQIPVLVLINDTRYEVLAEVFQGGQRFLLPAEVYAPILEGLYSDVLVTIYLGRYREAIFGPGYQIVHGKLFSI